MKRYPPLVSCRFLILGLLFWMVTGTFLSSRAQQNQINRVNVEDREVKEMLKQAERHRKKGYFSEAAGLYLELKKRHRGATVQEGGEHLFVGISKLIRRRIANWKPEHQNEFRKFIRGDAASLMKNARRTENPQLLKKLARVYFFSDPGKEAALELANRHFKKGDFRTAIYWWNQLLQFHPNIQKPGQIERRIAAALRGIGDGKVFPNLRKKMQSGGGNSSHSGKANQSPSAKRDDSHPANDKAVFNWRRPGGNHRGTGRVKSTLERYGTSGNVNKAGKKLVHLWSSPSSSSSPLFQPARYGKDSGNGNQKNETRASRIDLDNDTLGDYEYSPILPVVYRDTLYINDSSNLLAFDLKEHPAVAGHGRSKHLRWTYPGNRGSINGDEVESYYERDLGLRSLAAYGGDVYLHLRNRLHRLQASNGRQVFETHAPEVNGERLLFNGTPLITDQGVFVPLVRKVVSHEVEVYLARYDRESGKLDWLRYLGVSINNQRFGRRRLEDKTTRKQTHLLMAENGIYVATNMGFVASVNQVTGNVNWVHDYSAYVGETSQNNKNEGRWRADENSPRGLKPPRIIKGTLFVLPWDSPFFLGFDLESGELELKHRMESAVRFLDHGTVEMIHKKPSAFFVRKGEETGFDLSILPLFKENAGEKKLDKSGSQIPSISPGQHRLVLGRKQEIWAIDRKNAYLKLSEKWPAKSRLTPHEMIATGDRILLVGPGAVTVLTTLDAIERQVWNTLRKNSLPFYFISQ